MTLSMSAPDLVEEDRVHRAVYSDPGVFAAEMAAIYRHTWVYLGHESEIAVPGDYKTTTIGTEPVVLCRTADGDLSVVVNRCLHRGATVCQRDYGNATALRCHYHGWTYDASGNLVGLPFPDAYPAGYRDGKHLARVPLVDSYRRLIFGCLDPGAVALEEHLRPVAPYIDDFMDLYCGQPTRLSKQSYSFEGGFNWKVCMENGLDAYHGAFTHRSFFMTLTSSVGQPTNAVSGGSDMVSRGLGNGHGVIDQGITPERVGRIGPSVGQADLDNVLADLATRFEPAQMERLHAAINGTGGNVLVYPNLLLIGVNGHSIRSITPIAPETTHVRQNVLLVDEPSFDGYNRLVLRMHESFYGPSGFGQPDDYEMFDRLRTGLNALEPEWVLFNRGMARETGDKERTGQITDETAQRAFYRQLRSHLSNAAEDSRSAIGDERARS